MTRTYAPMERKDPADMPDQKAYANNCWIDVLERESISNARAPSRQKPKFEGTEYSKSTSGNLVKNTKPSLTPKQSSAVSWSCLS